jgi:hypothetical protein
MRTRVLVLALALGAGGATPSAGAQVIVDQSSAAAATLGGGISFGVSHAIVNDFTLGAPATIRAASFYSLECCNTPWAGTLSYFFTPNPTNALVPSASPVAQGTVSAFNVTTLYSDPATNVIRRFDFNLDAPLVLGAGSYFFGLMANDAAGAGSLAWRTVAGSGLSANTLDAAPQTWILQSGEAAFQLHGSTFAITSTTTPEPATLSLLGGGLAVIGGLALRRRRRA